MVQATASKSATKAELCVGGGGVAPKEWIRPTEDLLGKYVVSIKEDEVVTGIRVEPEHENYDGLTVVQLKARVKAEGLELPRKTLKSELVKLVRGLEDRRTRWLVLRCIADGYELRVEFNSSCRCNCFPRYATAEEIATAQAEWGIRRAATEDISGGVRTRKGYAEGGITDKVLEILSDGKKHRVLIMADEQLEVRRSRVRSAIKTLQRHGYVIVKVTPGTFQLTE